MSDARTRTSVFLLAMGALAGLALSYLLIVQSAPLKRALGGGSPVLAAGSADIQCSQGSASDEDVYFVSCGGLF